MKIVHICIASGFYDGWNYQENMLAKYHKLMENDVTVITSQVIRGSSGVFEIKVNSNYINEDGVKVIRLPMVGRNKPKKFRKLKGVKEIINKEKPQIIFIHNIQFFNIREIVEYAQKSKPCIYVDSHVDFSNSASNFISKEILHKLVWRNQMKKLEPYVTKFYGVLPSRVEFLKKIYCTPKEKTELLVMGADDTLVEKTEILENRYNVRKKYDIPQDSFLIVTGGKIDRSKSETMNLLHAMKQFKEDNVWLLIFGSISNEYIEELQEVSKKINLKCCGWLNSLESYECFSVADLVVFPGRHSVFWEQVVAQRKPMICKYWEGVEHIDMGGNVVFLKKNCVDELVEHIKNLIENPLEYKLMLQAAQNEKGSFLYSNIAKKSIDFEENYL